MAIMPLSNAFQSENLIVATHINLCSTLYICILYQKFLSQSLRTLEVMCKVHHNAFLLSMEISRWVGTFGQSLHCQVIV